MSTITEKNKLFSGFPKYLMWWLVFAFVGGALQPVTQQLDRFWTVKLYQSLSGLPVGLIAVVMLRSLRTFSMRVESEATHGRLPSSFGSCRSSLCLE
ncbi:hypothetical protein M3I53_36090 [Paraburkholderia sp. CNPSo 3272]|uniref:hypothetical protein n=1 Tax=Paraburkholderia sp. CNPSo 3272 TaxID=2940931 RepID=UPI0020B72393|nr:hypothetical protein [Paraburkholderia sp. CNPSo 3272]MCP3728468.1 hypothetical protein [Paraburkholderia sp. CNPSo 3272]